MMRRGFTVVELLIIITIMGILLTLAVVNLSASQVNARDAERKTDVENIALHLENYYRNQNPDLFFTGGGTYLGAGLITSESDIRTHMPDIDPKSLYTPGTSTGDPLGFVRATNTTTTVDGVRQLPSRSYDKYVYQPLTANNTLCFVPNGADGECRKFNIFYWEESTNTVKKLTSKNQ